MQRKKRPARAAAAKKATVHVGAGSLMVSIDPKSLKAMVDKCKRETGKVSFGIKEVAVTKLGRIGNASVIVN